MRWWIRIASASAATATRCRIWRTALNRQLQPCAENYARVIRIDPVYGGIALGLAFWLFPIYLKKPIERWLFADDDAGDEDDRRGG